MRDAFFGQGGEDFAEDVVYVGDGVELAGKGRELGGKLVRFETLLLFTRVMDAEPGGRVLLRSMRQKRPSEVWKRHLLLLGSSEFEFNGNLKRRRDLPHQRMAGDHTDRIDYEGKRA